MAPALIPTQARERVTTARRAAVQVARLLRSGALTPVSGPPVADEALRDLRRARAEARRARKPAHCRRNALLRRQDLRSTGQAHGRPAPRSELAAVVWPTPAPQMVCQADVRAVTDHTARRQRLAPGVAALQARRGVPCTGAVTMVAARGELPRVDTPRQRRRDLGLTPSDDASGALRRQGGSTPAGHTPARRALVDGAWA